MKNETGEMAAENELCHHWSIKIEKLYINVL